MVRKANYTSTKSETHEKHDSPNSHEVVQSFELHPTVKILLTLIFTSFLVLSALKTFLPEAYLEVLTTLPFLNLIDKVIPALNKPIGNYTIP